MSGKYNIYVKTCYKNDCFGNKVLKLLNTQYWQKENKNSITYFYDELKWKCQKIFYCWFFVSETSVQYSKDQIFLVTSQFFDEVRQC